MTNQPDQGPTPHPSIPESPPSDPLESDPLGTVRTQAGRWLPTVSLIEFISVLVLLGNRVTVHLDIITSLLGPVHGCLYLATIACALLARVRWPAKVLAVLPVVGGLLASAYASRRPTA